MIIFIYNKYELIFNLKSNGKKQKNQRHCELFISLKVHGGIK